MASMPQDTIDLNLSPMAPMSRVVIGSIDTHKDLHVAAVIDAGENVLATHSFSTTRVGYRALVRWVCTVPSTRPRRSPSRSGRRDARRLHHGTAAPHGRRPDA
jgi:hypothetical protein